ncbi:hypothetical protein [Parashewanella tropica]|uniref:hypothetical protein n=1 Tax=Parashewanella tropica TaxID=2547970 RepID=UPI0015AADD9B|nr:hypothetical protein [Parashewanella tropica]
MTNMLLFCILMAIIATGIYLYALYIRAKARTQCSEIKQKNKLVYTKVRDHKGNREVYDSNINQWLLWKLAMPDCKPDEKAIIEDMFNMEDDINSEEGININSISPDVSSNSSEMPDSSSISSHDTGSSYDSGSSSYDSGSSSYDSGSSSYDSGDSGSDSGGY